MIDPMVLIGLGALFLVGALYTLIRQRRTITVMPNSSETIVLPSVWDEGYISEQIERYHNQPSLLNHFMISLKERFLVDQDHSVAKVRTKCLDNGFPWHAHEVRVPVEHDSDGCIFRKLKQFLGRDV